MRYSTKPLAAAVVAAGSVGLAPVAAVPPVHVLVGLDAAVHVLGPRIGRRTRRALAVAVGAASGGIGTAVATSVMLRTNTPWTPRARRTMVTSSFVFQPLWPMMYRLSRRA